MDVLDVWFFANPDTPFAHGEPSTFSIPKKWSTPDLTIWAISAAFPMKMELVDACNTANI